VTARVGGVEGLAGGGALDEALAVLVQAALAEDLGPAGVAGGDLSSLWTVPEGHESRGEVVAKEPLVLSGVGAFMAVISAVDPRVSVTSHRADGDALEPGEVALELTGPTRSILAAERTALNFLGRLSGVATLTARYVAAVQGTGTRIVDTRKTTPGWRLLEKAAVRHGGGTNHRLGLWDMVLVKDNHIDACGGVAQAARAAVQGRGERTGQAQGDERSGPPAEERVEIEVEVRDLEELEALLGVDVDRILLDNMSRVDVEAAVARVSHLDPDDRPLLEASGNVTLETVAEVAATGVDLVSVGALTHSAPVADLSLLLRASQA